MKRSAIALVVALAALAPSAGCEPAVEWLPDSSGFVYSESINDNNDFVNNRLIHFDIRSKQKRVVVDQFKVSPPMTPMPAVSPDGKRIAIFCAEEGLLLRIYDLDGKVLKSTSVRWPVDPSESPVMIKLDWKPNGEKLLAVGFGGKKVTTGVYDLGKDTFAIINFDKGSDWVPLYLPPTNKGFVAGATDLNDVNSAIKELALVDWEGKVRRIDAKFDLSVLKQLREGQWEKDTLVLRCGRKSVRLDTDKLVATVHEGLNDAVDRENVRQEHTFPGGSRVRVIQEKDPLHPDETRSHFEFLKAGGDRPQKSADAISIHLFPSPNRKLVAAVFNGAGWRKIVVLDSDGKTLAETDVKMSRVQP